VIPNAARTIRIRENPITMSVIEPVLSGYLTDSLVTLPDGLSWLPLHTIVLL
jgi:hypothetical protein